MTAPQEPQQHGRELPWLPIVRFHKEIVARAEQGFFSLNGRDDQADRWTSLPGFSPDDLAGPWTISAEGIRSRPFRLALEQGQHDSLFLGGPCFLGWVQSAQRKWMPQWRPLLYREVALEQAGDDIRLVPQQGTWSLTPLLYGLFDRMEVDVGASLDEFAGALIEMAAGYAEAGDGALDQRLFQALFSKIPGVEEEFTKQARPDTFHTLPTPWVLFAPTGSLSAFTRYLMQDYERLESLLVADEANIGGLRLLDDRMAPGVTVEHDVLPVIPLNSSQRSAVQRILEERPLTVISGPPGTGKSQVVVALLLNAWALGKTVLFASNNNKAVDVVRERVERFESEFPLAVRAGAKQRQNIQEVLRRTLNMAGATPGEPSAGDSMPGRGNRQILLEERANLLEGLASKLPQRIDESRKTALRAYGEYRSTLAMLADAERQLRDAQHSLGFGERTATEITAALQGTQAWLDRIGHYKDLIRADEQRQSELGSMIAEHERRRDRSVEEVGLAAEDGGDWRWLRSGPSAERMINWEQRLRSLLEQPIEQRLEEANWDEDYSRWQSAADADTWAGGARAFTDTIRQTCSELSPKLSQIHKLTAALDIAHKAVLECGLTEEIDVPLACLGEWTAAYAELVSTEPRRLDFLPWSRRASLQRTMQGLEQQIRPGLPLAVLTRVGVLDYAGRGRLAAVIEIARPWIELRDEWEQTRPLVEETEGRFAALRSQAASLKLQPVSHDQGTEAWLVIGTLCEKEALLADRAAQAWRLRVDRATAEEELRAIAREWSALASGVPLREAWRKGLGRGFDTALSALGQRPNPASVLAAREVLYSGTLSRLLECWQTASDQEQAAEKERRELRSVPQPIDRVQCWWKDRPTSAFVLANGAKSEWPSLDESEVAIVAVRAWCDRWDTFVVETQPHGYQKAASELKWAVEKLEQAIETLPAGAPKIEVVGVFAKVRSAPEQDWPLADLNQSFAAFSPDRIRGRIDALEAELERGSFEDAKSQWLTRLRADDEAVRAVDALEKSIRRHKGEVVVSEYGTFRTALRAVPIWITTAQASQAIPLEPELFDIVVIDEASQCTLTNLLPLMYRGRTLAVIGDDNQLPAIPTIQESEELALARKHGIEEYLSLVGHATNDVYKTATESLPRRRADVLMLEEHFRSHPQIIGFSNRYIYLQGLELKKDPSWGQRLPIGSGVHSVPVSGLAKRGKSGRSWVNEAEANAVIELTRKIKEGDSRSLSLGIVTPFAAQKDLLRERLDSLRMAAEVLVDTAYGFQGDERDVIIFSPVVAKGMTGSAGRWVESPPNLVNVAITRAREALFVVGDFDHCLQQEGILRRLAMYCRDIQLLRDTSPAELELFSWMVVKGWEPQVHPHIGDIEVDFVLVSAGGIRLAIEVDGREHHEETVEQDKARDAYLVGQSYDVLRLPAREVLETPFEVVHLIESRLRGGALV
jgi:hypothetical protein